MTWDRSDDPTEAAAQAAPASALAAPAGGEDAIPTGEIVAGVAGRDGLALLAIPMRTDLATMLLPIFAEGRAAVEALFDGHRLRVYVEGDEARIAGPADRKILNFLAGAIANRVRSGLGGSRHIQIETRPLIEALHSEGVVGGAEYERLIASLNRLMATVVETTMPLGDGIVRERRFRWIDAYEHDNRQTAGGKAILALKITLSEDAYAWMTRTLGFDVAQPDFAAITSSRSSAWRIYEICLARLVQARTATVAIPIDELRQRIPASSPIKVFKSRTLRQAFDAIERTPQMRQHITLRLERKTPKGFEEVPFSKRVKHEELHVRVLRGGRPLPRASVLVPEPASHALVAMTGEDAVMR